MLIDPDLIPPGRREELLRFLRHPFSAKSCAQIEAELPLLGPAYRASAANHKSVPTSLLMQLLDRPDLVFQPQPARAGPGLGEAGKHLLQAQVVLMEESLRDDLERVRNQGAATRTCENAEEAALALRAASLHEAAFLALAGAVSLQGDGRRLEFSLTPLGSECMRNRVATVVMQAQTEGAMRSAMLATIHRLRQRPSRQVESIAHKLDAVELDRFASWLLDAAFSLNSTMQADAELKVPVGRARQLCRWFALLELVRLAGEGEFLPKEELLERLGLDLAIIDELFAKPRKSKFSSDQGIHRTRLGGFTLGGAGLGHAINCCKHLAIHDAAAGKIGERFEIHVRTHVDNAVAGTDYLARPGFKCGSNDTGLNYDCDLILYEPGRQKLFFVQTKWKRDGRTATMDDEIRAMTANNSPMTHGVSQLTGLRERLADGKALGQIRDALGDIKLSDRQILDNSHFIVVHTLPYFSAYMVDGVAVYEWNLFRNLLRRGKISRSAAPGGDWSRLHALPTVTSDRILRLEDPADTIAYYFAATDPRPELMPRAMEARLEARYSFEVGLAPSSVMQKLMYRVFPASLAIVRPYI